MVLVCNMAFAKSMIHILERMVFELLCTNVLVVGKIEKVLFTNAMLQTKTIILLCTKSPCTFNKWEILFFAVYTT